MSTAEELPPGVPTAEGSAPDTQDGPPRSRARSLLAERRRATIVGAGVLVAIVALVVTTLNIPGGGEPGARTFGPSESAGSSPTTPGGSAGTPSGSSPKSTLDPGAGWASAGDLPPVEAVASLDAMTSDRLGVSVTTAFKLTSLGVTPAAELARGVQVDPAVAFTITRGADERTAILRPAADLSPGRRYRFTLRTPDDALGGSWIFQTAQPLRVVGTVPRSEATLVPVDTGIEMTFDQDGVGDVAPYFSISPRVGGRFEQHGRTWVFVPDRLAYQTIYRVTIRHGVSLVESDQVLAEDVTFAFETAPKVVPQAEVWVPTPARRVLEIVPSEAPLVAFADSWPQIPTSAQLDVAVFRFSTFEAAIDAFEASRSAPGWAAWSDEGLVPTAGLPVVASFTAELERADRYSGAWIRFPAPLERGWYLAVMRREARDAQVFLQVTDLATFSVVSETETLAWVNDVTTHGAIEGASVRFRGMALLGRTDADGLVRGKTPTSVRTSSSGILVVRARDAGPSGATQPGRAAFVPVGLDATDWSEGPYASGTETSPWRGGDYSWSGRQETDDYWLVASIDRTLYHPTDEVDVWGLVRGRTSGRVPGSVEIRLGREEIAYTETADDASLAIARRTVKPDPRTGSFQASIPFADLPYGSYRLQMFVAGDRIWDGWLSIEEFAKPSYRIAIEALPDVAIAGDPVTVTATATFFDGTPVAGVGLNLWGFSDAELTTDESGVGSIATTAAVWEHYGSEYHDQGARPARGEEWEIPVRDASVLVFPSAVWVDGDGEFVGDRLHVSATVHGVDVERVARERAEQGWVEDPRGAPAAGRRVTVQVTELTSVRIRTGRIYDFISKRAIDEYKYETRERDLGTRRATTAADGTVAIDVPVGLNYLKHRVTIRATDSRGRAIETVFTRTRPLPEDASPSESAPLPLEPKDRLPALGNGECSGESFVVGADVRVPFWDRSGSLMPDGEPNRYLFYTGQRGLGLARVQASPVFVDTFRSAWVPGVVLGAVRFTGGTYVQAFRLYALDFDPAERALTVDLATDAQRYRPGEQATIDIRVRNALGGPVAADVVVRVIDEKLYAMDVVQSPDSLWALYRNVDDRILRTHASHPVPVPNAHWPCCGGCGDTTGGGGGPPPWREDFRDVLFFGRVTTGTDGRGSASFDLSDDITSWRVSASAVTRDMKAGEGTHTFSVGLPFFIEAPLATEFVAGDLPTLVLRAQGTGLRAGAAVTYTVSAPTLGLTSRAVQGLAFGSTRIALPTLTAGDHEIRIAATSGSGTPALQDALVRTIHVVATRFTQDRTAYADLTDGLPAVDGDSMATYVFSDAGRGRYLGDVLSLVHGWGDRVDVGLAAVVAREVLVDRFDRDVADLPEARFVGSRYQNRGGVTLLPYSSADLALSARVALIEPDPFDRSAMREYFTRIYEDDTETRERRMLALAGLAGLGATTIEDVTAALADPELTIRERLYLALAAAKLGDHATALAVERDLLARHGERLGAWLRLRVGDSLDDTIEATALVALIGAVVGDPVAEDAEAYVEANPAQDDLYVLQRMAYIHLALDRLPSAAARFAYTVGGTRHDVKLEPGEAFWLTLTPDQRSGLSAERLGGRVSVAVDYEAPVDPATLRPDASITVERVVIPASPIPENRLVEVLLRVTLGPQAIRTCYWVTDLVPSGLMALADPPVMPSGEYESDALGWWWLSGHRVSFCAYPGTERTVLLAYWARIVTPGTFRWEPALVQASGAPESLAMTPETTLEIR